MNALYYLLEANAYLLVLYLIYKVIFEKNTFYQLNRYYLLVSVLVAFGMPLVDFSGYFRQQSFSGGMAAAEAASVSVIPALLIAVYFLGLLTMAGRLALRLWAVKGLINRGEKIHCEGYTLVSIPELNQAFSFMNFIFVNPRLKDSELIIIHESVHIRQGHSLDLLFFEVLQCICWFNPLLALIRTDIKVIHEFIADQQTTAQKIPPYEYAHFLIENTYHQTATRLGSPIFNQSTLKKRIMKLNQEKSGSRVRLWYLLAMLMIPVMMGVSSAAFAKSYALINIGPSVQQDTIKKKEILDRKSTTPAAAKKSTSKSPALKESSNLMKDKKKAPPRPPVPRDPKKLAPPPPPIDPAAKRSVKNKGEEAPPAPPAEPAHSRSNGEEAPPPPPAPPKKKN